MRFENLNRKLLGLIRYIKEKKYKMQDKNNVIIDEINLLDYWRILIKRKRIIGLIVGSAFILSIAVSLALPEIYASTARLLPPQQETPLVSSSSIGLGSLMSLWGMRSPADLWVGILNSRTVKDAIIDRFNLKELYEAETIDDARLTLEKKVVIENSSEDIISVTVEDKSPEMAAQIANAYIEELDRINKGVLMTSGRRMRTFLEKRLIDAKSELAKAEDRLKAFQEKYRAVKLDDQSRAIIESIGNIKGQLMAKEVELNTMLSYAAPTNPQVEVLNTVVSELRKKLRELEEGKIKDSINFQKNIFIPTSMFPDLSLKYVRLLRTIKVQETLYQLLTQQYEMARIQETKDSPTIQILDKAQVPEKKSKPRRTVIVILSVFTSAFFSVFLSFFMEYMDGCKSVDSNT